MTRISRIKKYIQSEFSVLLNSNSFINSAQVLSRTWASPCAEIWNTRSNREQGPDPQSTDRLVANTGFNQMATQIKVELWRLKPHHTWVWITWSRARYQLGSTLQASSPTVFIQTLWNGDSYIPFAETYKCEKPYPNLCS